MDSKDVVDSHATEEAGQPGADPGQWSFQEPYQVSLRLLLNGLRYRGIVVTKVGNRDTAKGIKVTLAISIPQVDTIAVSETHRHRLVRCNEMVGHA